MVIGSLITSMASNTEGAKRFLLNSVQSSLSVVSFWVTAKYCAPSTKVTSPSYTPVVAVSANSAAAVLVFHSLSLPTM